MCSQVYVVVHMQRAAPLHACSRVHLHVACITRATRADWLPKTVPILSSLTKKISMVMCITVQALAPDTVLCTTSR